MRQFRSPIDLVKPRVICEWRIGVPTRRSALPKAFGPERAAEIRLAADKYSKEVAKMVGISSWTNCLDQVMTDEERAYVLAVWDALASGSTSFISAFLAIAQGEAAEAGVIIPA